MHLQKAQELGRLIGQTEEYKALGRAQEALEAASELKLKVDRLQQLAIELEQAAGDQAETSQATADEYERLFGEIQADPRYQQFVAAQANFDKLMLRVQEQMAQGMRKGAESSIITLG